MKLYLLLSIGVLLSVTGCGGGEPAAPEQAAEAPAPAEEAMAVEEPAVEAPVAEEKPYYFEGIIRHMHEHADQMDLINDALADGDLEASKAPARWLWRHDTMVGVPDDWQTYMALPILKPQALPRRASPSSARVVTWPLASTTRSRQSNNESGVERPRPFD